MSRSKPLSKENLEKQNFLTEIINSRFNLITDLKVKNRIINLLYEIPEKTLSEKILKSYLYLMIGNIARSDNILRSVITTSPKENWMKADFDGSFYHGLGSIFIRQLFTKISKHPADRRTFELLCLFLRTYYNDEVLIETVEEVDTSSVESSLGLAYTKALAPELINFLRLLRMSEASRIKSLRDLSAYPLKEQSYWIWPFVEIDPLVSDILNSELLRIEKEDELWFIYLMENEKMADFFSKKHGKSFLPGRRAFLKNQLQNPETFMMGLYKIIQLGDVNPDLVHKTIDHITGQ